MKSSMNAPHVQQLMQQSMLAEQASLSSTQLPAAKAIKPARIIQTAQNVTSQTTSTKAPSRPTARLGFSPSLPQYASVWFILMSAKLHWVLEFGTDKAELPM